MIFYQKIIDLFAYYATLVFITKHLMTMCSMKYALWSITRVLIRIDLYNKDVLIFIAFALLWLSLINVDVLSQYSG